jgi:adenylate cyclase
MERKLAAILAADVVGYSRLMGEDEAGTLAALKAIRAEFIEPTVAVHRGRVVKLMGDGTLVEFGSVIDALNCAVAIQREMNGRNAALPADRRIVFRIGINLGDVIVDGDDIYGNGVNVAARLEALAEPGGICISGRVLDQVEKNVDVGFASLGPQTVKNIDRPVNAYKVLLDPADAGKVIGAAEAKAGLPWHRVAAVVALMLALGAGGAVWLWTSQPKVEAASVADMAFPLPAQPSVAVLPFDNLSADPAQEYMADGLTEEIITTLSKVPDLFVIARTSTLTYKGEPVSPKRVAEEQGVRYVLQGSMQRAGDRLRVSAQLVDAVGGRQLWAERYVREFTDSFALQDEIAQKIMVALQVQLTEGEELRRVHAAAPSPEAFELMLKSRFHHYRMNREDNAIARELSGRTIEIAPDYAEAWEAFGWQNLVASRFGWTGERAEAFAETVRIAERAYELDPNDAGINGLLGWIDVFRGRYDEALAHGQRAVELGPSDANALAEHAWILGYAGRPEETIPLVQKAMRLSPYYPAWFAAVLGWAYMLTGDYQNAIPAFEQLIERKSLLNFAYARLAGIHAHLGNNEKARFYAAELLKDYPDFRISEWSKGLFYRRPQDLELELSLLRKAGLPE